MRVWEKKIFKKKSIKIFPPHFYQSLKKNSQNSHNLTWKSHHKLLLLLLRTYRKKPQKSHIKISKKFPKNPIKTHKTLKKSISYIIHYTKQKNFSKKNTKRYALPMEKIIQKKTKKKEEKTFKKLKNHFLSWHLFSVEEIFKSSQSFFVKFDTDICVYWNVLHTFHST